MTEIETPDSPDQPPAENDVEAPRKASFSYRFRSAIHRRFPWVVEHPSAAESREYYRARDPEDNIESAPPEDEFIDLRCIWVVEFYTPSHAQQLLDQFRMLGWDKDEDGIHVPNPVTWLRRLRERPYGGGWLNLGTIRRPGCKEFFSPSRTMPLPAHVAYARGELFCLTSSLTCIVMGFMFDDSFSRRFDSALRTPRQTYLKRLRRGHRIMQPSSQKADDIRRIRAEARQLAGAWFTEHLPGLFSSGILDGQFPSCEYVSLREAEPFAARTEESARAPEYLFLLDMDLNIYSWSCAALPGLRFAWPTHRDDDGRYHAILASKDGDFDGEMLRSWGGPGRSAEIAYVDRMIKCLLGRWAILPVLSGYSRHLNAVRDSAALRPDVRQDPVAVLQSLGDHLAYNVDIAAVTAELLPFADEPSSFDHDVTEFKPCNRDIYKDADYTLARGLRSQISERAAWLQKSDQSMRDQLTQLGSLLGAKENLRVQRKLSLLTIVIVVLTIIIMILTGLMLWNTLPNTALASWLDQLFDGASSP